MIKHIKGGIKWFVFSIFVRKDDILIVGLPKTGTTWLKTVIYEILSKDQSMSNDFDHVNYNVYEYGNLTGFISFIKDKNIRVIKTHKKRNFLHRKHGRVVGLRRDIYENIVSYYIYCYAQGLDSANSGIVNFLSNEKVPDWFVNFYKTWSNVDLWIDFNDINSDNVSILSKQLSEFFPLISVDRINFVLSSNIKKNAIKKAKKSSKQSQKFNKGFMFVGESTLKLKIKNSISDSESLIIKTSISKIL
jgi:hypothetical protein